MENGERLLDRTISPLLEIEAAPRDNSIVVEGPRHPVVEMNPDGMEHREGLFLYTESFGLALQIGGREVGVQVDRRGKITQIVHPSVSGKRPQWGTEPVELAIPEGGFVLVARDHDYDKAGSRRFAAEACRLGEVVKLRRDGERIRIADLLAGQRPSVCFDQGPIMMARDPRVRLTGRVHGYKPGDTLHIYGLEVVVKDGCFSTEVHLKPVETNYVDAVWKQGDNVVATESIVICCIGKRAASKQGEVLLWVDQSANARRFQSSEDVRSMLERVRAYGATGVIVGVKGYEGFASYKRNDLTGRPYVSEMKGPHRAGAHPDLDLLAAFVQHGHALGLTVHASVNVFTEASMLENAVLDQHPDWEQQVYRPEDNGAIVPYRNGNTPDKIMSFVNPLREEVRRYQLSTFEEILLHYDVDGVNMDRCRYDNDFADFSELTRERFASYLAARGKLLKAWPDDVYRIDYREDGQPVRIEGAHYIDWWAFRSLVITSFMEELRDLVTRVSERKGKAIQLSSYAGSWYESMYVHGLNWASSEFRYDPRLNFAEERIYTEEYRKTSYIRHVDFLMIGTYQGTLAEMKQAIAYGYVLTRGEVPLYASVALNQYPDPAMLKHVMTSMQAWSDGLMLFDASLLDG